MSSAPVNLNRLRKQKARAEKRARADENAARFGRTKAETALQTAREEAEARRIEAHRRERGPQGDDDRG
ncbi:DUF4169 family protein [Pseudoroseicyclus aestuarii]|uniref:Uncharacterized protein DUF4169 n=1 Tax=Pseudoroseicyclus aestuarii TaxID=1795041 RepID=A0A318TC60_9RHOB|nr:DUF4169 family protein [Pseudoroseicyclus aestuarii]PYE85888.1 uncharacterized protein DUF4169 [Pseudoroseicyclus aestuarii]